MALRRRDLEGVLAFLGDAHGVDAPEALTTALLDRLAELVGCEFATYQTFDWPRRRVTAYVACSNEGPDAVPPPYVPESFWRAEKPPHWTDAALHKLSDACQRRERERIGDEGAFNAEFRTVDTLGFRVGDRRTRSAWLHFDSQSRDFGEREREIALTLRPHLETLWRKALVRRQVAELVEGVGRKPDGSPAQAILLFETDGHIENATGEARRLLRGWFGTGNGRLPRDLHEWATVARPGDRFTVRRNGAVLAVEAAGEFTLTLRERISAPAGLTPRERQVLELVGEGLANAEIARRLWVTPSTVAKHLEQAYRKLGVHSRTAALSRLAKLPD